MDKSDDKILLKSGTNEMELLVFQIHNTKFGINVAKVREIVERQETTKMPNIPPAIEGTIILRGNVLALVNLGRQIEMEGDITKKGGGVIIIIEFNETRYGMLVDSVDRIYRLNWDKIKPPSNLLNNLNVPLTGTVLIDDETVLIVDIETVFGEIFGQMDEKDQKPESKYENINLAEVKILFVDDSASIRKALDKHLRENGFKNITICTDGQNAWETIQKSLETDGEKPFDIIITDIEMPRMDGLHLTSKIKTNPNLKNTPVILFSSIVSEDNKNKGKQVGADYQVTKFQGGELIDIIQEILNTINMA